MVSLAIWLHCVVGSRCPSNFRSLLFSTCPPTRLIRSWAPPTSVRHCDFVSFQCLGYTLPHVWSPPIFLSGILRSESDLGTCRTVNCLSDSGSPTPLVVSQFADISRLSNISAVGSSSTGSGTPWCACRLLTCVIRGTRNLIGS